MTRSLKGIYRRMNPTGGPEGRTDYSDGPHATLRAISMRQLIGLHRWPGDDAYPAPPRGPLSWRSVVRRHTHPATYVGRALVFNTYLMPGFEIPWNLFFNSLILGGGLPGVLERLGTSVDQLLQEAVGTNAIPVAVVVDLLNLDAIGLLQTLGVSPGKLADRLGIEWLAVVGDVLDYVIQHANPIMLRREAIRLIAEAVDGSASGLIALLTLDRVYILTKIMDYLGIGVKELLALLGIHLPDSFAGEAPVIAERAAMIGRRTAAEYDLMVFNEAWRQGDRDRLIEACDPRPAHVVAGPERDALRILGVGSGLLVLSRNRPIREHDEHVYVQRGDAFQDADAWSRKAALLTRIDLGVGVVDWYSTHLFNGGGIDLLADLFPPSRQDRLAIKLAQVRELAAFIAATHRRGNIVLLSGDFNLDARGENPTGEALDLNLVVYRELTRILGSIPSAGGPIELDDLWHAQYVRLCEGEPVRLNDFTWVRQVGGSVWQQQNGAWRLPDNSSVPIAPTTAHYLVRTSRRLQADLALVARHPDDPDSPRDLVTVDSAGQTSGFYEEICALAGAPGDFCHDPPPRNASKRFANPPAGSRIDYLFVQRPEAHHRFMLDVSLLRRRRFIRDDAPTTPPIDRSDEHARYYLSDHLGLDITLIASPLPRS